MSRKIGNFPSAELSMELEVSRKTLLHAGIEFLVSDPVRLTCDEFKALKERHPSHGFPSTAYKMRLAGRYCRVWRCYSFGQQTFWAQPITLVIPGEAR